MSRLGALEDVYSCEGKGVPSGRVSRFPEVLTTSLSSLSWGCLNGWAIFSLYLVKSSLTFDSAFNSPSSALRGFGNISQSWLVTLCQVKLCLITFSRFSYVDKVMRPPVAKLLSLLNFLSVPQRLESVYKY